MKAALNLSLGQHITLTPQLQQAIKLLQLSTVELNQEIQQIFETNPMLEIESSDDEPDLEVNPAEADIEAQDIPKELAMDTRWEDIFQTQGPAKTSQQNSDDSANFENIYSATTNLRDHLTWQMELTPLCAIDRAIATAIIDSVDEQGFLQATLTDIQEAVNKNSVAASIELDEIEAVLHRVQQFDPIGVAARDLRECMLLQLQQLPSNIPHLGITKNIVTHHLAELGQHNYKFIMQCYRISETDLREILALIQSLNPYPGEIIQAHETQYIIPDITVKQVKSQWLVELNHDAVPRLKINQQYASMVQRANNSTDNVFLKNNLQEARWFIKSLQSRQETLLNVANCIVEQQKDFFEYGDEAMKPMVLHDIAQALDLHESTISRVTTNKYMHTPRGVFELKYFFSSHVGTSTGGECSSTAIRAFIKKLVAAESNKKPLSDQKIAEILQQQGIEVARRTVAKYREALNIPPSNERKSLLPRAWA